MCLLCLIQQQSLVWFCSTGSSGLRSSVWYSGRSSKQSGCSICYYSWRFGWCYWFRYGRYWSGYAVLIETYRRLAVNANHVNLAALARCTSIAALTLDSLPHCGLVVSVISYTGNNHKNSYMPCAFVFCVAPIITVILMLLYIVLTGQTYIF